jgi:hypothetical protein
MSGNSCGNIVNGGYAANYNGSIYYVNGLDVGMTSDNKLYKVESDWSGKTKISDDKAHFINIADDWIYYSNMSDGDSQFGGKIYKIKVDGTERTKLNDYDSTYVSVCGDWIYYTNGSVGEWISNNKIYKIKTDGTSEQMICDDMCSNLVVEGDWIYYLSDVSSNKGYYNSYLYRIKLDGSEKTKVYEIPMYDFIISNEQIIFNDDDGLSIMDMSGQNVRHVATGINMYYNTDGTWIYYSDDAPYGGLYRIKPDGTNNEKLSDNRIANIHIVGDWIYYASMMAENTNPYRIKTDGLDESPIV